MTLSADRAEAIRRLDSIMESASSLRRQCRLLRDFLMGDEERVPAPYDAAPEDPAAIEARYGVRSNDTGDIPDWVQERIARLPVTSTAPADPDTGTTRGE